MTPALTTAASTVAALIAAMPSRDSWDWQEQDLAVAFVLEMLIPACEGNGDAAQFLQQAVDEIRATVKAARQRAAEDIDGEFLERADRAYQARIDRDLCEREVA